MDDSEEWEPAEFCELLLTMIACAGEDAGGFGRRFGFGFAETLGAAVLPDSEGFCPESEIYNTSCFQSLDS